MFVWLSPILDRYELLWLHFWVTRDSLLADILGNSYTHTMNVKKQSKKYSLIDGIRIPMRFGVINFVFLCVHVGPCG